VDLRGARRMFLAVNDAGDGPQGDTASWAGAMLMLDGAAQARPEILTLPAEAAPPIASSRTAAPRLNYPRITGATPGRPFLFRIPASGAGPLALAASRLPAGPTLHTQTGVIPGALRTAGRTTVHVTTTGPKGRTSGDIVI